MRVLNENQQCPYLDIHVAICTYLSGPLNHEPFLMITFLGNIFLIIIRELNYPIMVVIRII